MSMLTVAEIIALKESGIITPQEAHDILEAYGCIYPKVFAYSSSFNRTASGVRL